MNSHLAKNIINKPLYTAPTIPNCITLQVLKSFCTFARAITELQNLVNTGADVIPIMSETSYSTDTRFGKASDFQKKIKDITHNDIIKNIKDAEPIGPKNMFDMLVVLPCTGNSLAKIASGIADSSVTLAVKAHLRNQRPVLIAVSTNDGLGTAAQNIGALLNRKHLYFVPFTQDDCIKKPNSLVADFKQLVPAVEAAFEGRQLQPILCR